jgi:lysozyme
MAVTISARGAAFIARHEGFVSTAYRDPVGVLTIGYGFTLASRIFAEWWRRRYGRALRMGDRISRADADALLRVMVDEEYGAAVNRALGPLPQHQHDAACSVAFNLGPRSLGWRWAQALKAGNVGGASSILAVNYNTAGGRRLPGLVRRRREEAALLLSGDYGDGGKAARPAADPIDHAAEAGEMLTRLGYETADLPAAIRTFQADNPPLVVDGLWGPASRSTAQRQITARGAGKGGAAAVPAGGAAAIVAEETLGFDWTTIAYMLGTAGAVAVLAYFAWVNRGRIWAAVPAGIRGVVENLFRGG